MFGKLGDMMGKLKEAKQKMEETKAKLETIETNVESLNGEIKIKINGNRVIKSLELSERVKNLSKAELEIALTESLNKAIAEANEINEGEMKKIAMGMLPGGLF
jgi:DNA-binding protein YbaB